MITNFNIQPANPAESFMRGRSQAIGIKQQKTASKQAEQNLATSEYGLERQKQQDQNQQEVDWENSMYRKFGTDAMFITEAYGDSPQAALSAAQSKVKEYLDLYAETGDESYLKGADTLQGAVKSGVDGVINITGAVANKYMGYLGEKAQKQQEGQSESVPFEVASFEHLTQGMSPQDKEEARRIKLGMSPRASSAASKAIKVTGSDGKERAYVMDATGKFTVPGVDGNARPVSQDAQEILEGMQEGQSVDPFTSRTPEEEQQALDEAKVPIGMTRDETGRLKYREGSPQDRAMQSQKQATKQILDRRVPSVLRDVTRALELASTSGPVAGAFAIPKDGSGRVSRALSAASPAYELNQHLESIKSNISIDELQSMREASPTGGALGQVPVRQQEFLMQVQGSLMPTLKQDVLEENLRQVSNTYAQLLIDATYGDEMEWEEAIKDGRATMAEAQIMLGQRQDSMDSYMRETDFNQFGQRKGKREVPSVGNEDDFVPTGWEDDWEFLNPEERKQVMDSVR